MNVMKKVGLLVVVVCSPFTFAHSALAHVTVKPAEVTTASYQTFMVSVPNEKTTATTAVKVLIPSGVTGVTPTVKQGWTISTEKTGEGEDAITSSITWAGGQVPAERRDEFTFSAKTPNAAGAISWKAYQTYADGVVVSWDQVEEGGHSEDGESNKGPASVTIVSDESAQTIIDSKQESAAESAKSTASTGLYVGLAALSASVMAIVLSVRGNKK